MRFVTFEISTPLGLARRSGVLTRDGSSVIDLAAAREVFVSDKGVREAALQAEFDCPSDLLTFMDRGDRALDAARETFDFVLSKGVTSSKDIKVLYGLDEITLLTPLPVPRSIRNFSLSEKHMLDSIETMKKKIGGMEPSLTRIPPEWYNLPAYYKTTLWEVYGPEEIVPWPDLTAKYDYELELAAVIGKRGRNVSKANAKAHIFGFMLYTDWSTRDFQQREMSINMGPGLCKDCASSLGPCIATPDEFDVEKARLVARINGEVWTDTTTALQFTFEELIEYVTQVQTIMPGDIFTSGTVPGGSGSEQDRWFPEGSVVELEAEGIGILRNTVGKRGEAVALPKSQQSYMRAVRHDAP
ncbi:fumarylacetoacetate hydrolase family protein [uncultured Cohaesibacter sp.]|uniref:fumarylacetoacetate hydrolase family protein n=1 Tax=uncultured Cohaesibacter sp. TaxID=1002546 RepID=UPI00292D8905|nr:fumarylacetoacetate hydrolase family protein [uncultured Cohaesibacter sp.]